MGKLDIFWQKKNQHSAKYLLYFVNGHSFELSKIELQEDVRNSWYIWSEFLVEKQMILIKKLYLRLIVYKTQGCQPDSVRVPMHYWDHYHLHVITIHCVGFMDDLLL